MQFDIGNSNQIFSKKLEKLRVLCVSNDPLYYIQSGVEIKHVLSTEDR